MICLYLKIPENFVFRIIQEGFLVVYMPLVRIVSITIIVVVIIIIIKRL